MNRTLKFFTITIGSFVVYYLLFKNFFWNFKDWINIVIDNISLSYILAYLIFATPLYIALFLLHKPKYFFESLGLNGNIKKAIILTLICTLPMLIGNAIGYSLNTKIKTETLVIAAIFSAFIEEVVYRGFLFGQLFKYTKIGFIPSIFIASLVFASGHLYQSTDFLILLGILATTFLGSLLFAWLYIEWKYNLWVAIFLHLFMNIFWIIFSVSSNALGNVYVNVFRVITILLAIVLTVVYKKKKRIPFVINKRTLWIKKSN